MKVLAINGSVERHRREQRKFPARLGETEGRRIIKQAENRKIWRIDIQ